MTFYGSLSDLAASEIDVTSIIRKTCPCNVYPHIYIFIAIALDESIFLDVLHFPMKNIMSRDLEATPMGEATSKPIQ